jgi:hypothetical protein
MWGGDVLNNAKEYNQREQIIYHISLPICHDGCQETKRWVAQKMLEI